MGEAQWKTDERRVAQILGGVRVPVNGRGLMPDVSHARFAIEVKRTMRRMALADRALEQAEQAKMATGRDILPVAIIHYTGTHLTSSRVVMTLGDFVRIVGVTLADEFLTIPTPEFDLG